MLIILPRISLAVAKGFDMILVRSVSITRCQGVVSEVWTQRRMIFSSSSVDSLIELNCRIWPQAPATLGNVQLHRPRILCKGSLKRFLSTTVNKEIASLFAVLFYKFKRDFRRPIKNSCRFFFFVGIMLSHSRSWVENWESLEFHQLTSAISKCHKCVVRPWQLPSVEDLVPDPVSEVASRLEAPIHFIHWASWLRMNPTIFYSSTHSSYTWRRSFNVAFIQYFLIAATVKGLCRWLFV